MRGYGAMINYKQLFNKFHLSKVKLNLSFAELEFDTKSDDEIAAWEMYVELITRIITQPLSPDSGDEQTALNSVYSLFSSTRDILKKNGRTAQSFSKVSVVILNQVVRPFTAKWHKISLENGFKDLEICTAFRKDLEELQADMRSYASLLAYIARVEDITDITSVNDI